MLNLSEKHVMIQKIAEKIAKDKVSPRAKEIDATGAFPWDLVDIYKKYGFLCFRNVLEVWKEISHRFVLS
jgi:alkylation response protein AidB-like acyl-CoA dehydrogenase